MKIQVCTASMQPREETLALDTVKSWGGMPSVHDNSAENIGLVGAYQHLYKLWDMAEILVYLHTDVAIYDDAWERTVADQFDANPQCAVVGFGGATHLGHPDIYKTRYHVTQLARGDYGSNVTDAEMHGRRITEPRRVAVLDGFCIAVRRSFLEECGGWPVENLTFHCYDTWIACMVERMGYETWTVPVRCKHFGGGTSVKNPAYEAGLKAVGRSDADVHAEAHRWIYNEFRDVLPMRAK